MICCSAHQLTALDILSFVQLGSKQLLADFLLLSLEVKSSLQTFFCQLGSKELLTDFLLVSLGVNSSLQTFFCSAWQ
jgi:hypothetical protein